MAALHLAGVNISWNRSHRLFENSLRLLDLPMYVWNNKNYWLQHNGDCCLTKEISFYENEKQADGTDAGQKKLTTSAVQISDFDGAANHGGDFSWRHWYSSHAV